MTSDSLNFIEGPTKLLALKMVSILYRTVVTRETERERERERMGLNPDGPVAFR